jgi:5'-3' exonuclease
MQPVLLIDGDYYCLRCCAATERDVKFDEDNHILASNEVEAWDTLSSSIWGIANHFGTKDFIMCLGEGPYFRHSLYPEYKKGRSRKPLAFSDVRARMKSEWRCVEIKGLEADDVMGILATKPGDRESIIVARDKDMKGVPAKVWDGLKFTNVTEEEADYFHMYQTLTGDVTDGYKGCPKVGPVTAKGILQVEVSGDYLPDHEARILREKRWRAVVGAFVKAGLTEDDALLNARLARILRWRDWDSKKKEPILWTPPPK